MNKESKTIESSMGDRDAWKFKPICFDCVNKDGGSCFIF